MHKKNTERSRFQDFKFNICPNILHVDDDSKSDTV